MDLIVSKKSSGAFDIRIISRVLLAAILVLLLIGSFYSAYINDTTPESQITFLPNLGPAPPVILPSITGDMYNLSNDDGLIRIVSFIYTRCPGDTDCSLITINLGALLTKIQIGGFLSQVKIITIDFDYWNDTIDDLHHYADEHRSANFVNNWEFLLGNQSQTNRVLTDWNYDLRWAKNDTSVLPTNSTNTLTLSHGTNYEYVPFAHPLLGYLVDQNGFVRNHIIGSSFDINLYYEQIAFLANGGI